MEGLVVNLHSLQAPFKLLALFVKETSKNPQCFLWGLTEPQCVKLAQKYSL